MYCYIQSEPRLWTVGFYSPDGKFQPESDWSDHSDAAARAAYLNGVGSHADWEPDGGGLGFRRVTGGYQSAYTKAPAPQSEPPEFGTNWEEQRLERDADEYEQWENRR
jgi:hypothetical protein